MEGQGGTRQKINKKGLQSTERQEKERKNRERSIQVRKER